MDSSAKSVDEVVEEIMRIHKSLPPRPGIDDIEAAIILIRNADNEEQSRIEAISRQKKRKYIPEELFNILLEMQKQLVQFQTKEQKREAVKLLDLENCHQLFDEMIQRASKCCSPSPSNNTPSSTSSSSSPSTNPASISTSSFDHSTPSSTSSLSFDKDHVKSSHLIIKDDSYVNKSKFYNNGGIVSSKFSKPQIFDSTLKPSITSGEFKLQKFKSSYVFLHYP